MDEALAKLRILPYRYMADPSTLFPEVAPEQDIRVLRELLANAIAHGDYCGKSGLVYLDEYEDKVSITSIGSFPRDRVQAVLRDSDGSRIPRNPLLKGAMEKLGMLDPEVRGIRRVCEVLLARYFPLPEYDFTFSHQAMVQVYGKVLNETYTNILFTHRDLSLEEVLVLDQVQKHNTRDLPKDAIAALRKRRLIAGRFPYLYLTRPEWKRRYQSSKQLKAVTPAKLPQKERSASQ